MTLGDFVKERRLRLGLEQADVAMRMGNRQGNWISQVESGKIARLPDPETVTRLATALECTEAELIAAAGYNINAPDQAEPWGWAPLTPEQERLVREIIDQFKRDGE